MGQPTDCKITFRVHMCLCVYALARVCVRARVKAGGSAVVATIGMCCMGILVTPAHLDQLLAVREVPASPVAAGLQGAWQCARVKWRGQPTSRHATRVPHAASCRTP